MRPSIDEIEFVQSNGFAYARTYDNGHPSGSMRLIPEQFGSVSTVFDSVQDQQEVVGIPHRKLNKLHRERLSPTDFHSECCALTRKALMLDA